MSEKNSNLKKIIGSSNNLFFTTVIIVTLGFNVIYGFISMVGKVLTPLGIDGKALTKKCFEILNNPMIGMILSQALIILPTLIYIINRKKHIKKIIRFNKMNVVTLIALTFFTYAMLPVMSFINMVSMMFVKNKISSTVTEIVGKESLLFGIIVVAVLPAFVEETLFRGVLYNTHRKVSIKKALILNGLLFGLLHGNFNQFAYAFFMGIVFSLVVEATDTVISTIWCHFLINGNSILSAFLSKNVKNVEIADSNVITINTLIPWACMALFALSIAILILIFIAKYNNRYDYLKKHLSFSKKNKKGKNVSLLSPGLICAMLMSFVYMICIEFMTT